MTNTIKYPVTVYAEMTPNPATMKFVANKMIIEEGESAEYLNLEQTKNSSPLAEELFKFPFVKSVFITRNFVAITKNDRIRWDFVTQELRVFITNFLSVNDKAVTQIPAKPAEKDKAESASVDSTPEIKTDTDKLIVELLEEFVRPAVESDGGAIHFKKFEPETGVVTVILKGACSGCPSSTATLKGGIHSLLRSHLPQVNDVVALEG